MDADEYEWPFDLDRQSAVFTSRSIVFENALILRVFHDDDGDWQFLDGGDIAVGAAAVVALEEIVKLDPTVLEVADLKPGWHAHRPSISAPWIRSRNTSI